LFGLTKDVCDGVKRIGRGLYLVTLGAYSVAEEETRGLFDRLVERGERFEKNERVVSGATERVKRLGKRLEETVQRTVSGTLQQAGIPSRDDIHKLTQRVEGLTRKVNQLNAAQ
jgi:polyhydroxyalkanoate synthesis regulator phasin